MREFEQIFYVILVIFATFGAGFIFKIFEETWRARHDEEYRKTSIEADILWLKYDEYLIKKEIAETEACKNSPTKKRKSQSGREAKMNKNTTFEFWTKKDNKPVSIIININRKMGLKNTHQVLKEIELELRLRNLKFNDVDFEIIGDTEDSAYLDDLNDLILNETKQEKKADEQN